MTGRFTAIPKIARLLFLASLGAFTTCTPAERQPDDRPNIILIMADDMGFSDLGCYGSEIHTPNLDYLAANGMRFTQFYNNGRCCPTRASLLTGLYPHQAGIGEMTSPGGQPGYQGFLTPNTVTLAEVVKQAGYNTGMTGKWHVALRYDRAREEQLKWTSHQQNFGLFADAAQVPTARGFDRYFGNIWGVVDYFDPFALVNGTEQVMTVPSTYYHTDAISDSTVAYIDRFSREDKPFFLYVAHTAPHWPLHALPADIARYEEQYKAGWQAVREARYKKMMASGLFNPATQLAPWMLPDKEWKVNPDSGWDAHAMAVHAAMVDRMDQGIGRIIEKLRERNELDNTIIFFLSDNGASQETPLKPGEGIAATTRDGRAVKFPATKSPDNLAGPQEVYGSIGMAWAHALNAPFKYWKSKMYEGGICTPLIAYWPRGIAQPNSVNASPGHVIDFMATCIDAARAEYPKTFNDNAITPQQGTSLLPLLTTGKRTPPEYLFWEHFGSKALREGNWKLVQLDDNAPWQLFNLDEDRTELNDLALIYPDRLKAMQARWLELAQAKQVYPKPSKQK